MPAPLHRGEAQREVARAELIQHLKDAAEKLGRLRVTRAEFAKLTGIPWKRPHKLFGGYSRFVRAAGLENARARPRLSDDEALHRLRNACLAAGGLVGFTRALRALGYRKGTLYRRWGSWRNLLRTLRAWCERHDPGFPYLAALPGEPPAERSRKRSRRGSPAVVPVVATRRYGPPLNLRGLLHAPVNEPGVVLLFGALAEELGFAVEHVTGGFPDCEAKRRTADGWARVRIEFEYESRNFRTHRHDPGACDLIVCWEHNWPECPVEVIELKAEVEKRAARVA